MRIARCKSALLGRSLGARVGRGGYRLGDWLRHGGEVVDANAAREVCWRSALARGEMARCGKCHWRMRVMLWVVARWRDTAVRSVGGEGCLSPSRMTRAGGGNFFGGDAGTGAEQRAEQTIWTCLPAKSQLPLETLPFALSLLYFTYPSVQTHSPSLQYWSL